MSGTPLSLSLPGEAPMDRFWYWRGASGRRYIHTVYGLAECPPLPGAIYVAVRRRGTRRVAVAAGRFQPFWDHALAYGQREQLADLGADELHVHLLASNLEDAEGVLDDLSQALSGVESAGQPLPALATAALSLPAASAEGRW